jgi:hypothetical protein
MCATPDRNIRMSRGPRFKVDRSGGAPPVGTKPFGKYRILANWVVDDTLTQSKTKIGIVGSPLPKRRPVVCLPAPAEGLSPSKIAAVCEPFFTPSTINFGRPHRPLFYGNLMWVIFVLMVI